MLHTHHQDRNYIAALEADRLRTSRGGDARTLERVVAAAARGDESAWSALVARFRGRIMRVAHSYGISGHQADDIAQETWLRLYRSVAGVRDPQALGAWIDTTARRETLRALKGGRREDLTDEEIGVEAIAPDEHDELQEQRAALAEAVTQLPERQRMLMEALMSDPEPSYAEISARLGLPIGSIGPTRGRCVERLRGMLAPELDGDRP